MAKKQFPELEFLLARVAATYGGRLSTANDYESLSFDIERKTGLLVSASTLRRLWGYDTYDSTPRESTLDSLARYVGLGTFQDFRLAVRESPDFTSGFLSNDCILSQDLVEGDRILLRWNPNRQLEVRYLGAYRYVVENAVYAKLQVGDRFEATALVKGYPMFLPQVERGDEILPLYVAGIKDGLTMVRKL